MGVFGCGIVRRLTIGKVTECKVIFAVRTGQAHRTLIGHTAPVTCLQFDEQNIVTGGLDKTIRVCLSFTCSKIL